MNKLLAVILLTFTLALLSGCGVKGPLYFPTENQQTAQ